MFIDVRVPRQVPCGLWVWRRRCFCFLSKDTLLWRLPIFINVYLVCFKQAHIYIYRERERDVFFISDRCVVPNCGFGRLSSRIHISAISTSRYGQGWFQFNLIILFWGNLMLIPMREYRYTYCEYIKLHTHKRAYISTHILSYIQICTSTYLVRAQGRLVPHWHDVGSPQAQVRYVHVHICMYRYIMCMHMYACI